MRTGTTLDTRTSLERQLFSLFNRVLLMQERGWALSHSNPPVTFYTSEIENVSQTYLRWSADD